jgi:hypothetical protein
MGISITAVTTNFGLYSPFMRFDFFESLSHEEAKTFFDRFLEVESARVHEVLKQCSSEGVPVNFGIDSVAPFMRWVDGCRGL